MNLPELTFDTAVFQKIRIDAVDFMLNSQLNSKPLSKIVADRIRAQRAGQGFVLVPSQNNDIDESRLHRGHIWDRYWATDKVSISDPSFDLFILPTIRWFLQQDEKHVFVVEEQAIMRDSGLEDVPQTAWLKYAQGSVYYFMNMRSAKANLDEAIDDIWTAANDNRITGFLTRLPDTLANCEQDEEMPADYINAIAGQVKAVITLAFDGEGHFIWWMADEETSSKTRNS